MTSLADSNPPETSQSANKKLNNLMIEEKPLKRLSITLKPDSTQSNNTHL